MNLTAIPYVDLSWNPITGCSDELPCFARCWARRMAARQCGRNGYPADDPFRVTFHPNRLDEPQRCKKPRRIAVCLMGDLWHRDVRVEDRAAVIRATNLTPQHTYLFLTKRIATAADEIDWTGSPNLWIGTSVEDQEAADERIPHLLRCHAAVRFVSVEPLIGLVDLSAWLKGIHWVIVGGESGPKARPCDLDHVRQIVQQGQGAGVPVRVKQLGRVPVLDGAPVRLASRSGSAPNEWPEDLRIREMPEIGREVQP